VTDRQQKAVFAKPSAAHKIISTHSNSPLLAMREDQDQTLDDNDEWEDVEDEETSAPQPRKPTGPSRDEIEELSAKSTSLFM